MVHPLILQKCGTTRKRLRDIFEVKNYERPKESASKEDWDAYKGWQEDEKVRLQFESEIRDALQESVTWGLRNYQFYAAVDLAWDTTAVSKTQIPLLLYAQGKIDMEACSASLKNLPNGVGYVKKDDSGKVTSIDLPKFVETSINLVRSIVTRRWAAQSVKYSNLYPYYKYESRSTGIAGRLKADVMSQEAEIVVDGFGYRHHESQVMLEGLLYGHVVDFLRSPWEVYSMQVATDVGEAFDKYKASGDLKDLAVETVVYKEGAAWINPHPTRLIVDNSSPLAAINDDVGPKYIGYWDVVRWGDVKNDPVYFNTNCISYGGSLWPLAATYSNYFTQYFDRIRIPNSPPIPVADSCAAPVPGIGTNIDPAGQNDRRTSIGIYSGEQDQMSMFQAQYFRKLIPSNHRMGSYPHEIWVRFVVGGDSTVIYAEPMYSTPAAALSINESDSRQLNASFAHDVMWAQDMMSNLVTQMLLAVQGELLKIIAINKDVVDADDMKRLIAQLKGTSWAAEGPLVIPVSVKQLSEEMSIKLDAMFHIGETNQGKSVTTCFQAMAQLMSLLERMASMSPAEQGQPAPREISATEVTEIATTTQNVYSHISDAIDEFRASKKRILYESMVCGKVGKVQVPVVGRYSHKTVKAAGFELAEKDQPEPSRAERVNVIGDKRAMVHDYIFTTRDGSERPVNTQAANSLVQLLGIIQNPQVLQDLGKENFYNILNEIFRMSGTGVDLNLEIQDGESPDFGTDQLAAMGQVIEQLKAALTEVASATQQNAAAIGQQEEVNTQQQTALQGLMSALDLIKESAKTTDTLKVRMDKLEKAPEPVTVDYSQAPEEIRRQLEAAAGLTPAKNPIYIDAEVALAKKANPGKT